MKHTRNKLRATILALSASIVLPNAPVFGQDAPVVTVTPPPPAVTAPPAPAPSPVLRATPAPTPRLPIAIPETDPAPTARTARTARATPRAAAPARRAAPVRAAASAPAPAAAPAPAPEAAPAAPVAQTLPPPPAEIPAPVAPAADTEESGGIGSLLPWIIGGVLLIAAAAFFLFGRRRRRDEVYEDTYYEEPAVEAEPGFARAPVAEETPYVAPVEPAPIIAAAPAAETLAASREVEEPEVVEADEADVEALTESAAPVAGRPWLEFLMRPVRAGTSQDDAIVQFELTVGNTGSMPARDVRISTWMVATGQGTDMESSLIEAPADAQVSEVDIAAGDGARVEAELAIPKGSSSEPVLPVVVADARYRLPDGSEGRTHAAFAIGMQGEDEALSPFPVDRASGLRENVEARLHGEPERV